MEAATPPGLRLQPDPISYNTTLTSLYRHHAFHHALDVLHRMTRRGVTPNATNVNLYHQYLLNHKSSTDLGPRASLSPSPSTGTLTYTYTYTPTCEIEPPLESVIYGIWYMVYDLWSIIYHIMYA